MYQSLSVRTYGKNQTPVKIKKVRYILLYQTNAFIMAGVTGIEPALTVLETAVLPLYDTPREGKLNRLCNLIN